MKWKHPSSLKRALGIAAGFATGFVVGLPIVVAAEDLLPMISLTSPFQNQTVGNTVMVSASSDSQGLVGLQFKIDNQNFGSEITSGSCRAPWDSTKVADGLHTITAAGRDQYGNVTLTQPVTVLVSNPPYVPPPSPTPAPSPTPTPTPTPTPVVLNISAPLSGSTLSGSSVPIAATFPSNSQYLNYSLRDITTGAIRWSATGPTLSSGATSSTFLADLTTVTAGTYNLKVICQRSTGALASDIPVVVAPTLTTTLTITGGREYVVTASLKLSGLAARSVPVTFQVKNPLGVIKTYTATTDSKGVAILAGRLGLSDPRGTYRVITSAIASGVTSTATGTFVY